MCSGRDSNPGHGVESPASLASRLPEHQYLFYLAKFIYLSAKKKNKN